MFRYLGRRLLHSIPVIIAVTVGAFAIIVLIPGDPALNMLGYNATPDSLAILRRELGLDRSVPEQFIGFVRGAVVGDFGESILKKEPVRQVIASRAVISFSLLFYSGVIAGILAVPLAILSAVKRNRWQDHVMRLGSMITFAMPSFWLGLLLALFFAIRLGWLPVAGYDKENILTILRSLTLPAITIGMFLAPILARTLRSSIIEVMDQEYVEAARAKGYRESRVIGRHVMRNSLIATVTVLSLIIGFMISGSVIVENVFAIPGLGSLIIDAVLERDYPVIQALVLFFGLTVIVINLLADLMYAAIDPRVTLITK